MRRKSRCRVCHEKIHPEQYESTRYCSPECEDRANDHKAYKLCEEARQALGKRR